MRSRVAGVFVLAMVIVCGGVPLRAANNGAKDILTPLRAQWQSTRNLILGLARLMPEAKYDYRPTPKVRSFREQLTHIVGENYMYMGLVAGNRPPRPDLGALKTRAEILEALGKSYDYGTKTLAQLTDQTAVEPIRMHGKMTQRWAAALMNIVDNMDHYGNLVVYVRINGLVPPRTAAHGMPHRMRPKM